MRVYGLDFTSSPKKGKPLTLAECTLTDDELVVNRLYEFGSAEVMPLEEYRRWLHGEGKWANEEEWVAGIDFPFGMPLPAISHFGWAADLTAASWRGYMGELFTNEFPSFKSQMDGWTYQNERSEKGKFIKIQFKRLTDQLAHSQSPMKVSDNPYPGAMLYRGCKPLLHADVHIPPLTNGTICKRTVVEAYPRLVAQKFFPKEPEFTSLLAKKHRNLEARKRLDKSDSEARRNLTAVLAELSSRSKLSLRYKEAGADATVKANRAAILDGLQRENDYGLRLRFDGTDEMARSVDDVKGDLLDSVLCAVQAAWSFRNREQHWGIPAFRSSDLQAQVALEGWIADPALHGHFPSKDVTRDKH